MRPRLICLCNAMDDRVRSRRRISTDSPAAARKITLACAAVSLAGVSPLILSLGRGPADGSTRSQGWATGRMRGVPAVFCPFVNRPLISHLVSLVAPIAILWRLRRRRKNTTLLLYNRLASHVLAAWAARLLGYRLVLDLEDGAIVRPSVSLGYIRSLALELAIDRVCTGGALLACTALGRGTRLQPQLCYYGVAEAHAARPRPTGELRVLLGGTVSEDTGAPMLIEAIQRLRAEQPAWCDGVRFQICGYGDCIESLARLSSEEHGPRLTVYGRTTDAEYAEILDGADVGLALKPNAGALAHTTFPSKVIEIAAAGLLVLSTDISDVRLVFGDAALYLERDDPGLLAERLQWIVEHPAETASMRTAGTEAVRRRCAPAVAGALLAEFLFAKSP